MSLIEHLIRQAGDLIDREPTLALLLGGALSAVFFTLLLRSGTSTDSLQSVLRRLAWAAGVTAFLAGSAAVLREYLHDALTRFQHSHGRVTEANLASVRTIWGAEQRQRELSLDLSYVEETTERLESEDPTRPALVRQKKEKKTVEANPFISARHEVALRRNARQKGSALYAGYETECRFSYHLRNPEGREVKALLRFPLPSDAAAYQGLAATLNGQDVLGKLRMKEHDLLLERDLAAGEAFEFQVAFRSRGLASWYFQTTQLREIRDFQLVLRLPDLPRGELNYPEGCTPPDSIADTPDQKGSVLTYRLDHAISHKGMGIALPEPPQPGEMEGAVLKETEKGWVLLFAAFGAGLALSGTRWGPLAMVLCAAVSALGYGLLADLSGSPWGFWGGWAAVLFLLGFLGWGTARQIDDAGGRMLSVQLIFFGIVYPLAAGVDPTRQSLYMNLGALLFVLAAGWRLARRLR